MSDTAIPLPDEDGVVAGRQRAYVVQLFADKWAELIGLLSGSTASLILDWSVKLLSASMIAIPIYIFSDYLLHGVLLVSPPLFFMFLAGITGLALPRRGKAQEESLSQSGDRQ